MAARLRPTVALLVLAAALLLAAAVILAARAGADSGGPPTPPSSTAPASTLAPPAYIPTPAGRGDSDPPTTYVPTPAGVPTTDRPGAWPAWAGRATVTPRVVVGVDPGPRWTGLAVRRGDDYLGHELLRRRSAGRVPEPAYGALVIARVEALLAAARQVDGLEPLLVVEAANGPTGFRDGKGAALNPVDVFALGLVLGAVLARFPAAQMIPPDRCGRGLLACYPPQLRGARERGPVGTGVLKHCRSAWDAAGQAAHSRLLAALAAVGDPRDTTGAPAEVKAAGGLATEGLALVRPDRRQGHHRAKPKGGDAA